MLFLFLPGFKGCWVFSSFITKWRLQAPYPATSGLDYECFTIVLYDCNGIGLYCKTTILANSATARSVNCNHKVCCKQMQTEVHICDHKIFLVQATWWQKLATVISQLPYYNFTRLNFHCWEVSKLRCLSLQRNELTLRHSWPYT